MQSAVGAGSGQFRGSEAPAEEGNEPVALGTKTANDAINDKSE
jgi:hypothetical protein